MDLAESSFKAVFDVDVHLDNKANRILTAMAFLTAATVAIFAKGYTPPAVGGSLGDLEQRLSLALSGHVDPGQLPALASSIARQLQPGPMIIGGMSATLLAFFGYILFVLIGLVVYLSALGPTIDLLAWRRRGEDVVGSPLYFQDIGAVRREVWNTYWQQAEPELRRRFLHAYALDAFNISHKARVKLFYLSIGNLFFQLALAFIPALLVAMLPAEPRYFWFILLLGAAVVFIAQWSRGRHMSAVARPRGTVSLIVGLLFLTGAVLVLFLA
jgi:hypothetical protein